MSHWRLSRSSAGPSCLLVALLLTCGCAAGRSADTPTGPATTPGPAIAITAGDAASLLAGLQQAVKGGAHTLLIPPATYVVPATRSGAYHVVLDGASDLTIEAVGVTLVFAGRDQPGISLRNCQRVTWHGGTLQRATIPFSQGRIERLEEDGAFLVVRIDPGYPADIDDAKFFPNFWTNVLASDGSGWQAHYRGVTPPQIQRLGPDLLRVRMSDRPANVPVSLVPGTPLAWRGLVLDDVEVRKSSAVTLDGITIAGGSGMCFHERGGGPNTYRDCHVVPPPTPAGASTAPWLASCADGFHSSGAQHGPLIERCTFTKVDDDAIAIHGTFAMAMEAHGNTLIAWRCRHEENQLYGEPGQTLSFYDEHGAWAGEAVITAVRKLSDYKPAALPDPSFRVFQDASTATFLEFTCDRPVPCRLNWLISNPNCAGLGYVIRDCIIRDTFARGILPKGAHGLIEGNTIERTARAGIELMPELFWWSENGYSTDTIVRNNLFNAVSRNRQNGDLRHPGALTVFSFRAGAYVPLPGGHRNLLISGNTFRDCQGPNLLITSAQGVRIEDNTFERPMTVASTFGQNQGVDPTALVWVHESSGITAHGNRISGAGAGLVNVVTATASVPDASGLAAGFSRTGNQP